MWLVHFIIKLTKIDSQNEIYYESHLFDNYVTPNPQADYKNKNFKTNILLCTTHML